MKEKIVKIISIFMVLTLMVCTFAACDGQKDKYEEDPNNMKSRLKRRLFIRY